MPWIGVAVLLPFSWTYPRHLTACFTPSLRIGLSENAVNLVSSYLADRKQCVQIGSSPSTFQAINKGVPQGSILGSLLFNIFK